jgi:hypothetical protein
MHGGNDVEPGESSVSQLAINQSLGYDACDFAASGQGSIGYSSHQPDMGASVDNPQARLR